MSDYEIETQGPDALSGDFPFGKCDLLSWDFRFHFPVDW